MLLNIGICDHTMKVMLGIAAFEEEDNIERLLEFLINDSLNYIDEVYVVSSGSKDKTDEIVSLYSRKNSRIHLILEDNRKGKVSALNQLLSILENDYDIMVYMGADNLPEKGSINHLVECIKQDEIMIVGGRPLPLNNMNKMMGFFAHLLWNLHHLTSLKHPKISGELMAFKKGVINELPPVVINDDMFMQIEYEKKGYSVKYCMDATVFLQGPETLSDFMKQRKRVFIGHKQIEGLLKRKAPTMRWPKWSQIMKASPYKGFKGRFYATLFVITQGLAYILALFDYYRGKLPYKWDIVKTTKKLE